MIISQLDKVCGERKEVILPNNMVDSCRTKSIDLQEEIHEEYEESSVERSPIHPCLTARECEQQIVPTVGEGQREEI